MNEPRYMALTKIIPSKRIFLLFLFISLLCLSAKANSDIYTIKGDTLVVNEGVTKLEYGDINATIHFTNVILPNSLKKIGHKAFYSCHSLKNVHLPDSVVTIGSMAFYDCDSLSDIYIPASVEKIGDDAFNNSKLNKIIYYNNGQTCYDWVGIEDSCPSKLVINEGVVTIDKYAFSNNNRIIEVVLPESLKEIKYEAFYDCPNLKKINIPQNCVIHNHALKGCISLNLLLLSDSGTVCKGWTNQFYCDTVIIPKGVKRIDDGAFKNCHNLKEIILPEGLERIGINAFKDCKSLKKVVLPEGLKYISKNAFEDCEALDEINFPAGLKRIDDATFRNCKSLKRIVLPEGLEHIGKHAFENCESIGEIVIPNSVLFLDKSHIFSNCTHLKKIHLPDSMTRIPSFMFSGCSALDSIEIPNTVTEIDHHAFSDCSSLKKVRWPSNQFYIRASAFENCSKLSKRNIPQKAKIEEGTFGYSFFHDIWEDNSIFSLQIGKCKSSPEYLKESVHGISVNKLIAFRIPEDDSPLLVQSGMDLCYLHSDYNLETDNKKIKCTDKIFTGCIPLNVGVTIPAGDPATALSGYAGFNMRFNFVSKSYIEGSDNVNYFDMNAKRFQPGFNLGIDYCLLIFSIGYRYTKDLVDFIPNVNSKNSYHTFYLGISGGNLTDLSLPHHN